MGESLPGRSYIPWPVERRGWQQGGPAPLMGSCSTATAGLHMHCPVAAIPPPAGTCPTTTSPPYLQGSLIARRGSTGCKPAPFHHYKAQRCGRGRFFAGTELCTMVGRAPWMATDRAGLAQELVSHGRFALLRCRHPPPQGPASQPHHSHTYRAL